MIFEPKLVYALNAGRMLGLMTIVISGKGGARPSGLAVELCSCMLSIRRIQKQTLLVAQIVGSDPYESRGRRCHLK